jgi:tRNA dimethylallyltransferase
MIVLDDSLDPFFLCGATATGKSAFAIDLAQRFNGEIINADAFQLYQGIETLSAAPSLSERSILPHHLYSILPVTEACDAMRYASLASSAIQDVQSRNKKPIIVGGSGLYLKFLTHGASPLPQGDPVLRAELDARTLESLVEELHSLDPKEASQTPLQNRRYVSRALEICLISGQKASDLRDQWETANEARQAQLKGACLTRSRDVLQQRIALRTQQMLQENALQEVQKLMHLDGLFSKAIGFQEIKNYLIGKTSFEKCEELITIATRQYAKRQETWFRREQWLQWITL